MAKEVSLSIYIPIVSVEKLQLISEFCIGLGDNYSLTVSDVYVDDEDYKGVDVKSEMGVNPELHTTIHNRDNLY